MKKGRKVIPGRESSTCKGQAKKNVLFGEEMVTDEAGKRIGLRQVMRYPACESHLKDFRNIMSHMESRINELL